MNPPPPSGGERRVGYPRARGATARAKPAPPRRLGWRFRSERAKPPSGRPDAGPPRPRSPPLSLSVFPEARAPRRRVRQPSEQAGGGRLAFFVRERRGGWGGNRKDGRPGLESGRGRGPDQAVGVEGAPDRPTDRAGRRGEGAPRLGRAPKAWVFVFLISSLRPFPGRKRRGRENGNDPSAGSPTETLLRLLLPLDSQV